MSGTVDRYRKVLIENGWEPWMADIAAEHYGQRTVGWQPIETAPLGKCFLVANLTTGPHRIRKECRDPHDGTISRMDWLEFDQPETHWHALPGLPL